MVKLTYNDIKPGVQRHHFTYRGDRYVHTILDADRQNIKTDQLVYCKLVNLTMF